MTLAIAALGVTYLHSEELIKSTSSCEYWLKQSTEDIIESLRPGSQEPLIVNPQTGMIWQGNTRAYILEQRGVDVENLPRETYTPSSGDMPELGIRQKPAEQNDSQDDAEQAEGDAAADGGEAEGVGGEAENVVDDVFNIIDELGGL